VLDLPKAVGICKNCGARFEFYTSASKGSFCSSECWHEYAKGKNAPNYKGVINRDHKVCPNCERDLPSSSFYKNSSKYDGLSAYCKECMKRRGKKYRREHRTKVRLRHKAWRKNQRIRVLRHIGGEIKCGHCGFSDLRALQVDHIEGGGNEELKRYGHLSTLFSKILKMSVEDAREKYQILCANCNMIKKYENEELGGLEAKYT